MKAKTVWMQWKDREPSSTKHWLLGNSAVFQTDADARWLNTYGYGYAGVVIGQRSKILGDSDES